MYVELGVALAEGKKIFVVNKCEKPLLLFHSKVKHVSNAEDLLKLI